MEAPEPLLSVESFSYRWLVKFDQTPEGPGGSFGKSFDDEALSFIEMDPAMPPSRRFSVTSFSQDFKFDFPVSQFPLAAVPAKDLFTEGHLLPLFFDPAKVEHSEYRRTSDSALPLGSDSRNTSIVIIPGSGNMSTPSMEACRGLPKQIFPKQLNFLKKFCKIFRLQRLRKLGRKLGHGTRNWVYPEESPSYSPRISSVYSSDNRRKSSLSESSIYEAVLHCKKSIGRETD